MLLVGYYVRKAIKWLLFVNCSTKIESIQFMKKSMAAPEFPPSPLVELQAVANAGNQWVALLLRIDAQDAKRAADPGADLHAIFSSADLLAALAPLDCIVLVDTPAILTPSLLALMPPNRVLFAIAASTLAQPAACRTVAALQESGYRILIDGVVPAGVTVAPTLRAVSVDVDVAESNCADAALAPGAQLALFGPHLARGVDSAAQLAQCAQAGFGWFSGAYPLHPAPSDEPDDGSSRKRMLSLLGLLAVDAGTRELENLLKQDPALSYHLLKLVNSAAFALSTPITSFAQAIGLLGRRQLQRWLQLLLFARQRADGLPNPLLPIAALRAAQMESLCRQSGGDADAQELAFMLGVFSLLDVLLDMTMADIAAALKLAPDIGAALVERRGALGRMLKLVETPVPTQAELGELSLTPAHWFSSQLHAYHWAIQVSRNL
jgi:EAL and modified HD-GYP domain-containing signal transduction protein